MVSDELQEEMKKWEDCAKIFINAGTGSGKTYFVINTYIPYILEKNGNILMLCNRNTLKSQIEEDFENMIFRKYQYPAEARRKVEIQTYQALEQDLIVNGYDACKRKYVKYHVIVCDEVHYFLCDSIFNTNTIQSFDFIVREWMDKQCIFISATIDRIQEEIIGAFDDINNARLKYPYAPTNLSHFWNKRRYTYGHSIDFSNLEVFNFQNLKHLTELIINNKEKWLIFVSSFTDAEKIYDDLCKQDEKSIGFCCSNEEDVIKKYKGRAIDEIKNMLAKENRFTERILISTAVLDNGISMKDKKLLNIAILTGDKESYLQMIGRKRILADEKVHLYLCIQNKSYFSKKKSTIHQLLNEYLVMDRKQQSEIGQFLLQSRDKKNIFLHQYMTVVRTEPYGKAQFRINTLSIKQWRYLYNEYGEICNGLEIDENFFIRKQLEWLGLDESNVVDHSFEYKQKILQEIIEDLKREMEQPVDKDTCIKILLKYRDVVHEEIDVSIRLNENLSGKKLNALFEKYNVNARINSTKNKNRKNVYYVEEIRT